ncbi:MULTISPECIES: McrB family protein [Aliivibrio]|uniref:ATP-binding protein n=1 Tax=Aliivibrio finisterrensis TaxID=511998 RepID=A0A4Q5KRL9_9GAMM|nr:MULTISPECIES: AAA family ATPase [Aliivibrio]MDD9180018.1 AAA family ATPase [Aliivibrio sp. A6]RYU49768.1 ATP-binding protein [Aliivibrio finisterrensis]RYU51339.1 ATP-binding protein [Aliivibrio finisterrensis]RYU56400.1 ATP-binding protein [Aliivibrio finisterrensis]RYU63904.1 ATP-binding protein [Aliivibrio finisterrensis]
MFNFRNEKYNLRNLVLALMKALLSENQLTLAELDKIFERKSNAVRGVIYTTEALFTDYKERGSDTKPRFFESLSDRLTTSDDVTIVVSNQWSRHNVISLLEKFEPYGLIPAEGAEYEAASENKVLTSTSLNQILYGPPGTGKTYHTIEAAVKAAEPTFTWANRDELKNEYVRLVADKRIRFVTFHQSYGYEEFVEGLSATTENEAIKYAVKDGVFKRICTDASIKDVDSIQKFDEALESLKHDADGQMISLKTSTGKSFEFTYNGNATFRVYPEATKHDNLGNGYPASIAHLRSFYITGDESDIYNRSYVRAILMHLKEKYNTADYNETAVTATKQNFVFIIDEINRGNISKIFGELITLIEPSKRKGAEEEIELVLPYSGDTFSVPDNLHIIGTMNTADRSLAMMDTALRRRFDFIEMMPKPELFNHKQIKGIDLTRLLNALNKRIEALYDREHTLGHAFLFPAYNEQDEDKAFELLKAAFKNKIIPLLEEYFYDDWNKIRLVLGDNQKSDEIRFVKKHNESYDSLFGSNHGLETYEESKTRYTLMAFDGKNSVWDNPQAYIAVYTSIK